MNRPYIICHILSALDGKITGEFMRMESARSVSEEYGRIRTEYQADAWLYATVTTKEFTKWRKPDLDFGAKVLDGDFVAEGQAALYYVSIDTQGEIGWESGTFRKAGRPDAHVIEVLTEQTPAAYRAYLRKQGVSYILAGSKLLDSTRRSARAITTRKPQNSIPTSALSQTKRRLDAMRSKCSIICRLAKQRRKRSRSGLRRIAIARTYSNCSTARLKYRETADTAMFPSK